MVLTRLPAKTHKSKCVFRRSPIAVPTTKNCVYTVSDVNWLTMDILTQHYCRIAMNKKLSVILNWKVGGHFEFKCLTAILEKKLKIKKALILLFLKKPGRPTGVFFPFGLMCWVWAVSLSCLSKVLSAQLEKCKSIVLHFCVHFTYMYTYMYRVINMFMYVHVCPFPCM